jgi:L-seryl-tRNA(Ser) seleniumtransferase
MTDLRKLPSVEQLLQTHQAADLISSYGRPLTLYSIRNVLEKVRADVSKARDVHLPDRSGLLALASETLLTWTHPTLLPVINASGVILHTNLGRAPLSTASIVAMTAVAQGYSNLEFDLNTGKRGSRLLHAEAQLQLITGAQAAVVVNNNAAAILLALSALAKNKRVVIARSQLVEIGGGFRVPDVMKQSGAKLVEIGTTNKVRLADYEEALEESTALVMRAHRSNFRIVGFTEEPEWKDVVSAAHSRGVACLDDLGSGTLLATERFGLAHEPTVQESLQAGTDLVCFSGDKLLGGPQAGLITGQADLVARIRKHPLARAVRADKLCLAALSATLLHYLKDQAETEIPVWRMIAVSPVEIKKRARSWAARVGQGQVVAGESTVGGGSLPGEILPTFVLALDVKSPDKFLERLRQQQPPVIARAEAGRVLLDPRTVLPEQDEIFLANLMNTLHKEPSVKGQG